MDNLNDPPGWNIRPVPREGSDGGKWNYALLVPMLGLAAFRWIWTRESQRQTQEVENQFEGQVAAIAKDLELKYKDTLTENRRTTALLELEKARQRVEGYKKAMASHSQHLMEERKQLQKEREELEDKKKRALQTGAARQALHEALQQEQEWQQGAQVLLNELEHQLVERQSAFCSPLLPKEHRMEIEKNLLVRVARDPAGVELGLENDIRDIFKNDRHCAEKLNEDNRKNGQLMWLYLKYWRLQVTLQKHKRAEGRLKGSLSDVK
ncbi:coiled-coil domain-containing protein 127-like [Neoarius graeffei]|uniref:coiled-coil domain-containing protein 127-like n=1 Tax=Neoarius graeffei TaxID=443677 RepID=UPI00298CCB7B|nr:coiled-coil domain-containing protein 127-like [Neoarius graeffei]XP_060756221.1 coiled-coil domain-containing protein 127-like [Neoarius graeffei]XP_060756222.1 coiled-coil domain-containing protein 127-like [Neoarius graeffei]